MHTHVLIHNQTNEEIIVLKATVARLCAVLEKHVPRRVGSYVDRDVFIKE